MGVAMVVAMVVLSAGGVGLVEERLIYLVAYLGTKRDKVLSVVPKRVTNKRWMPFTYTNISFHSV